MCKFATRLFVLCFLMGSSSLATAAQSKNGLPYHGYLELHGVPVNSTLTMQFCLYNDPNFSESANLLTCYTQNGVTVKAGHFSVMLDVGSVTKVRKALRAGDDVYLGVSVVPDGGTIQFVGKQKLGASGYSIGLNTAEVPIGAIIDWWRPAGSNLPLPEGFKIADGTIISDQESPIYGSFVPDLVNTFVMGVTNINAIGQSGGSTTHTHSVDLPEHTHSVNLAHKHANQTFTTTSNGSHSHIWASTAADRIWVSGDGTAMMDWGDGMDSDGAGQYPLANKEDQYGSFYTSSSGVHTHSVTVALNTYNATVNSTNYDPDPVSSTVESNLPPYFGLLKIVRIK